MRYFNVLLLSLMYVSFNFSLNAQDNSYILRAFIDDLDGYLETFEDIAIIFKSNNDTLNNQSVVYSINLI